MDNKDYTMETERLLLRAWLDADAEALYRYAKDPAVGCAAGWPPHTSADESLGIIRTVLSAPGTYAVVLKETGEPVGCVGLLTGDGMHCAGDGAAEAEIGYWLGAPYWGRGITTEAVRRLLRHCFENMCLHAVWCVSYEDNSKSHRVQEKCGFAFHHWQTGSDELTGEPVKERVTRITREEWGKG